MTVTLYLSYLLRYFLFNIMLEIQKMTAKNLDVRRKISYVCIVIISQRPERAKFFK